MLCSDQRFKVTVRRTRKGWLFRWLAEVDDLTAHPPERTLWNAQYYTRYYPWYGLAITRQRAVNRARKHVNYVCTREKKARERAASSVSYCLGCPS